jgi:hypothetical protein
MAIEIQDAYLCPFDQDFRVHDLYDLFSDNGMPVQHFAESKGRKWPRIGEIGLGKLGLKLAESLSQRDQDQLVELSTLPGGGGFGVKRD